MTTANIPLYGNIAVYGYVLNCWDTGVYFVPYMCKSSLAPLGLFIVKTLTNARCFIRKKVGQRL